MVVFNVNKKFDMAKFSKYEVMAKIAAAPMVPVFYNKDVEVCKNVVKAC